MLKNTNKEREERKAQIKDFFIPVINVIVACTNFMTREREGGIQIE